MTEKKPLGQDKDRLGSLAIKVICGQMREKIESVPFSPETIRGLIEELTQCGIALTDAKELAEWLLVDLVKSLIAEVSPSNVQAADPSGDPPADPSTKGSSGPPPSDDDIPF